MARPPFTYPFCYTPDPDIVAAAQDLIRRLDAGSAEIQAEPAVGISAEAIKSLKEGKMLGVLKV